VRVIPTLVTSVLVLAGSLAFDAGARTDAKPITARAAQLTPVGSFDFPVSVTSPPADTKRLFVVEKAGRIRVVLDGRILAAPFLDISGEVAHGNEPGLLSLAFSPRYARNRLFYIYYAGTDRRTHLLEFRRSSSNPNRADLRSRRQVLSFEHLSGEHFGGQLLFDPTGKLYLSTGDGGLTEWKDKMRAQRLNDPNGKILRVIPASGATRVVARGLRNPWRFAIDAKSGDFYIGDVGEFVRESIKFAAAKRVQGTNFGWPCFEGTLPSDKFPPAMCPGRIPPLLEYAREGGNCSVVAGVVAADPRLPQLVGRFLYSDYCLGEVITLKVQKGRLVSKQSLHLYEPGITSFGTDARRRIYIATAAGSVYRLDPSSKKGPVGGAGPATGKEIFLASGCGTCHALASARTAGTYGPDLDKAEPTRALVIERVTSGKGRMPSFEGRLTEDQIRSVADFIARP
jgi:Glucose / Sorbosone dehydrogenase/Cytochrome C oxidase, cbb3-type, subunit III